jgi:hypothetical protein
LRCPPIRDEQLLGWIASKASGVSHPDGMKPQAS